MNRHLANLLMGPRNHALLLVLLACLNFTPGTAGAASPRVPAAPIGSAQPLHGATTAIVASSWWEKLWASLESALSTRAGMVQFGAIIMLLALVIIWWRR